MHKLLSAAILVVVAISNVGAGELADVAVIDRTSGRPLPIYSHGGKLYVAGTPGTRYAIQIANRTGARILSVVAVDGVNVITGETAALTQNGYVFDAYQRYGISGWRKNQQQTAAFYFTDLSDSYASRTERPDNVGVIGVALFAEWTPPPAPQMAPWPETRQKADVARGQASENANHAHAPAAKDEASAAAPALAERLGTGHGERVDSYVSFTEFRRRSTREDETIAIYYDRYENLVARGIVPRAPIARTPEPFPGRFVPDPNS